MADAAPVIRYADAAEQHVVARTEAVEIKSKAGANVSATGRKQPFRPQQVLLRGNLEVLFRTHHKLNPQSRLFRHCRIIAETSATKEPVRSEEGDESKSLGGLRAPKADPVEAGHDLPVLARALDA